MAISIDEKACVVARAESLMFFLETNVTDTKHINFQPPIHLLSCVCSSCFLLTFGVSTNSLGVIRQGRVERIDRRFSGQGTSYSAVVVR
jgi:hypothetical protein